MSMPKRITQEQYDASFPSVDVAIGVEVQKSKTSRREAALAQAVEVRRFEIGLYWTRSAYFWAFIGAAFVAFGGTQTLNGRAKSDLGVLTACVGFVFSVTWFLGNRGSKLWQENWENHVDLLEDEITGPLYKTVLTRPEHSGRWKRFFGFLGTPGPYSVSKLNLLTSLYVSVLWVLLIGYALPKFDREAPVAWRYVMWIFASAAAVVALAVFGRTDGENHTPVARRRTSSIV